jgi:hypothetical protein
MGLLSRSTQKEAPEQWKNKVYGFGLLGGAVFGLLSSYMYARATEEDVSRVGKAQRISTGELLGLGLAVLAVIRQITELGKGPDRPKKK